MAVATVAHSPTESSFCASIVANRSFDLARNGHLAMEGFPNFKQAVQDLKNVEPPPQPEYSVCFAMNDSLVIKEAIIDQWMEKPEFLQEMEKLVKSHNDEFNKKGLKRGSQTNGQSEDSRPAKHPWTSSRLNIPTGTWQTCRRIKSKIIKSPVIVTQWWLIISSSFL